MHREYKTTLLSYIKSVSIDKYDKEKYLGKLW